MSDHTSQSATVALKPCPFCGGEASLRTYETESLWSHDQVTYTQVGCEECDYHIATEPGYDVEAPKRWNTRTPEPTGVERAQIVAWLREELPTAANADWIANAIERGDHLSASPGETEQEPSGPLSPIGYDPSSPAPLSALVPAGLRSLKDGRDASSEAPSVTSSIESGAGDGGEAKKLVARECPYNHPVGTRCPNCSHWPYTKGGAAAYTATLSTVAEQGDGDTRYGKLHTDGSRSGGQRPSGEGA